MAVDLPLRTARALAKSPFALEKRVGVEVGRGLGPGVRVRVRRWTSEEESSLSSRGLGMLTESTRSSRATCRSE